MIERARHMWTELRRWPTGQRFRRFHDGHAAHRSGWARCVTWLAAAVCFVIGVILAFIPGPAVLFFALTAALTATQSRAVARLLDRSEVRARAAWRRLQRWRRQRAASSGKDRGSQPAARKPCV